MPNRRRLAIRGVCAAAALTAAAGLTACSGTAPTAAAGTTGSSAAGATSAAAIPTAPVLATAGSLRIAAGYVPQPASPDVAAAYLTVTNTGSSADTLLAASSDASSSTSMHRTDGGSMIPVKDLPVPAGTSVAFSPGADHLMLEPLTRTLSQGGQVRLTLRFAEAGEVEVTVPVTGYPTGGGLPSDALTPVAQASS